MRAFECRVLCYNKELAERNESLGIKDEVMCDEWFKITINLDEIVVLREPGAPDETEGQCGVYIRSGDYFIIDVPYEEFKNIVFGGQKA